MTFVHNGYFGIQQCPALKEKYSLIRCINKAYKEITYILIIGNSLVCQHVCPFQFSNSYSSCRYVKHSKASNNSHTQNVRSHIGMCNILLHMIFNIDHAHNLTYLWKQWLYMDWFTAYVTLFIKSILLSSLVKWRRFGSHIQSKFRYLRYLELN